MTRRNKMNEENKTEKKSGILKMVGIPNDAKVDALNLDGTSERIDVDGVKKLFDDPRPTKFFLADGEEPGTLFPFTFLRHPDGIANGFMLLVKSSGNDRTELEDCEKVVGAKVKLIDRYDFRLACGLIAGAVELVVKMVDENARGLACESVSYLDNNRSWIAAYVPKFVTES